MTEERTQERMAERRMRPADPEQTTVRERFGGIDTPAALGGMFAGLGMLVFLVAVATVLAIPLQINAFDIEGGIRELGVGEIAVATLVILVSFFVGGWAAARIARFDGVINGVGVALWMLLLVAVSAAAGIFLDARYNLLQRAGLPDWFSQIRGEDVTALAVVAAVLAISALVVGSILGGSVGEAYNRRVNAATAGTVTTDRDGYRSGL